MFNAKVTRPDFNEALKDHPNVKLTATVSHGAVTKEFELDLKVKMKGVTESQSVVLDLTSITLPKETKENLILPTIGKNGSIITWTSSQPDIISTAGVVKRPDTSSTNADIKLTATCSKGNEKQTREFTITVIAWTKDEELDQALELVSWDLIKNNNNNSQAIESDLIFPATIGRDVKATWSLVSSTADTGSETGKVDIATGKVTRPTHTQGQVIIQIACKLEKNELKREKTLLPFILAPLPMTDEEILNTAKSLLESNLFIGDNESIQKVKTDMRLPLKIKDTNAERASISWSLVNDKSHEPVTTNPYIILNNIEEGYTLAKITQPTLSEGNIQIGLKALITVDKIINYNNDTHSISGEKYFSVTILAKTE